MHKLKKSLLSLMILLFSISSFSQEMNLTNEEPTDFMRSNGKIYVVLAVVVIIVTGIFIYLFTLDRKISSIEKDKIKNPDN